MVFSAIYSFAYLTFRCLIKLVTDLRSRHKYMAGLRSCSTSCLFPYKNILYFEQELLRRQGSKSRGGVSFMFVVFVGLLGIILGYLMKKT